MLGEKWEKTQMPIRAYLPTSGPSFDPEVVANMGRAFDGAVDDLGIGPRDESKREAVARFIILLAEMDGGAEVSTMRDKVIVALGDSTHIASLSKEGQANPQRA
jgi:hypothetical protein